MWKMYFITLFVVGVTAQEFGSLNPTNNFFSWMFADQCSRIPRGEPRDFNEALGDLDVCLHRLANMTAWKTGVEQSNHHVLLEVLNELCDKGPQIDRCLYNMSAKIEPCRPLFIFDFVEDFVYMTMDFICREKHNIAKLLGGGALQFKEDLVEAFMCITILSEYVYKGRSYIPLVEKCQSYDNVARCAINTLQDCSTPLPTSMFESFRNSMVKRTNCTLGSSSETLVLLNLTRQHPTPADSWSSDQTTTEEQTQSPSIQKTDSTTANILDAP